MKVLLTGASGFVGSHILDALRARNIPVAVLLRLTSDRQFINPHLPAVEVRTGSIDDVGSLNLALADITHVIHSAGCTRARTNSEFFQVNQVGTRNVVAEINSRPGQMERLVHISSLAVSGPATPDKPAHEDNPPHPISEYGKSKLAAELEVRDHCRAPYTLLRPPAVYGPRDYGFLPMFRAVRKHLLPKPSARQMLSIVFARDLAETIVACLLHPTAAGKTYFVASQETVSARSMAAEIASQSGRWTMPLPMPAPLLWPLCLGEELVSRLTGKAMLLNLQKYGEIRAPGWVCDPSRIIAEIGCACTTTLKQGVAETLDWYLRNQWLH